MSYRGTGLADVDEGHPEAFAVCDRCGAWRNSSDLTWQYDYRGNALANLQILVCNERVRCNDKPFEFYRPIVVGPDPISLQDARPESFAQDYGLDGFTAYTLWNGGEAPARLTPALVLAEIVDITDITPPSDLAFQELTLSASQVAQLLLAAVATRGYVLIYNPTSRPIATSEGTARMGAQGTIQLGYGEALFWSVDQGMGDVYSGPMTWTSPWANTPIWVWESGGGSLGDFLELVAGGDIALSNGTGFVLLVGS